MLFSAELGEIYPRHTPSKAPRRLQDIIDNARAIFRYTEGMNFVDFEENRLVYDAVERCLERICEAVVKLGEDAPALMPDQPWYKDNAQSVTQVLKAQGASVKGYALLQVGA